MKPLRQGSGSLDGGILILTALLAGIGLIMIYSSSSILAMLNYGDSYFFIRRQLLWTVLGFAALILLARYPYARLRAWALPLLGLCLALLLLVWLLPVGRVAGGAKRWLSLGPLSFQPAEMLKVVLVLYLADMLVRKSGVMTSFAQGVLPPLAVSGLLAGLLLLQPDMGTAVIILAVTGGMLFLGGARPAHLFSLALAALPAAFLLIYKVGYRRRRLDAFLDPWQEPLGKGFQMVQSFLALGSGGLWGRGLCQSQQKLFYLPTPHTDFIFSILGEELGFAGAFALVLLFSLLLWKGLGISRRCPDPFGKLLAAGLTLLLGMQVGINIGVTTGLLPTKGTTLPFISAGGSSLLFSLAAVGLLLSIARTLPEDDPA